MATSPPIYARAFGRRLPDGPAQASSPKRAGTGGSFEAALEMGLGQVERLTWPEDVRTLAAAAGDALENIARRMLIWRTPARPRTVLVTSSFAGEGRTCVALALAYTVAQKVGEKSLVVDADFARPCVAAKLGTVVDFGIDDSRSADYSVRDLVVWGLDIPLAIAPLRGSVAGGDQARVAATIRQIVQHAPSECALVIIDGMPLQSSAEITPSQLGADSAVLVTRRGLASPDSLAHARAAIDAAGLELVALAETFA